MTGLWLFIGVQFLMNMSMKTGLIKTDVTFNIKKLQSEYSKILEEFDPFEREMACSLVFKGNVAHL